MFALPLHRKVRNFFSCHIIYILLLFACLCLQIGVKGAEAIADCLLYNATISTLDLRANSLGDDVCIFKKAYSYWNLFRISEEMSIQIVGYITNM